MTVLMNFRVGESPARLGLVEGEQVIDINAAYAAMLVARGEPTATAQQRAAATVPTTPLAFLAAGAPAVVAAKEAAAYALTVTDRAAAAGLTYRREQVTPLVPIPNPPKVICVARNYAAHAAEAKSLVSQIPVLFARFPSTLIPHGAPVIVPKVSEQVDWEGELAFVVGKPGRYITRAAAMEHVAGYTIFNDVSVRDYQFRVPQYTGGKNFNNSGPIGPVLLLADDGVNPHQLEIVTRVNGEVMQHGTTADMVYDIPAIIEHISEFIELQVGDVIATGTPAGVGHARTPARYLQAGDVVSVEIPGIGVLENPVIADPFA